MEERNVENILQTIIDREVSSESKPVKETSLNNYDLEAVLEALGESLIKEEKFMKDNFSYLLEYIEENKREFEEVMDFYFEDRWEMKDKPNMRSIEYYRKNINEIKIPNDILVDRKRFFNFLIKYKDYNYFHPCGIKEVYIHFPEINITNSSRHKHKIVDLWMKFEFNFLFRMTYMAGFRSTKTWAEYNSGYNHSHMSTGRDRSLYSCCLGETDYRTLQAQLYSNFDKTDLTLFMQQLEDYLSWESLQGGPHMRMESIGSRNYYSVNRYLGSRELAQAYRDFIAKFPSGYNIELEDNGFYYKFKIIIDEDFKNKVTQVCPEEYKMLYDTVQKRQYIENETGNISREVEIKNQQYRAQQPLLIFRGNPVYFQIIDPNASFKKEENKNVINIAPENLINYIANNLESNINKYYIQKFSEEFLKNN